MRTRVLRMIWSTPDWFWYLSPHVKFSVRVTDATVRAKEREVAGYTIVDMHRSHDSHSFSGGYVKIQREPSLDGVAPCAGYEYSSQLWLRGDWCLAALTQSRVCE